MWSVLVRVPLIAANWKMNKTIGEASAFVRGLAPKVQNSTGAEVVICPPFTAIAAVVQGAVGTGIAVGGQDCYAKASGAFTGEVAPQMLKDAGCAWVIIGHSERRQLFDEADDVANAKLRAALAAGLQVIFCIGETLDERKAGDMDSVLRRQVLSGLKDVPKTDLARMALAYEPVWAIGTGVTASPEQAEEAHAFLRALVRAQYDEAAADALRIQYGGSVKADNAAELLSQPDVDGALVGGASLEVESFAAIVAAGAAETARASR
jgi:triosephosphate isomerase